MSLPNDKFLDWFKLKTLADDKLNVAKMTISPCDRVEISVGKEGNAGYEHFLLSTVFSKVYFFRVVKIRDCVVKSQLFIKQPAVR